MSASFSRARAPFILSLALLASGAALGTFIDQAPKRPIEERAGYRVLQADFHAHTRFSDGFLSPLDIVDHAARRGLDALAVSEHNQVFPAKVARAWSKLVHGPTIIVAEEVTTHDYHMLAIGIEDRIDARRSLSDAIDDVHAQGGVIAAAHPTKRFAKAYTPEIIAKLDATELMHPIAYQGQNSGIGAWTELRDFYEDAKANGNFLSPLGNSDYHFGSVLGITRTFVFARGDTEKDIVDAIRDKRTVVFDLEGNGYGDPELVKALEAEPLAARDVDYGYRSTGALDAIGRTLGFLGLLGVLAFRNKPKPAA